MLAEDRAKAFTSLLNSSKPKGTGLGLAIIGRIIEAHRGTILVESQPGQGTTMILLLPAS
jgi:signal transduction histidine kinase